MVLNVRKPEFLIFHVSYLFIFPKVLFDFILGKKEISMKQQVVVNYKLVALIHK